MVGTVVVLLVSFGCWWGVGREKWGDYLRGAIHGDRARGVPGEGGGEGRGKSALKREKDFSFIFFFH